MKLHRRTVCVVLFFVLAALLSVEAVRTPAKRGRTPGRLDSDAEEDNGEEAALMETAQKPVAAPLRRSSRHVKVPTKFGDSWRPALLTSALLTSCVQSKTRPTLRRTKNFKRLQKRLEQTIQLLKTWLSSTMLP